jgi:hypothetical protein
MKESTMAAIRTIGAVVSATFAALSLIVQLYGLHYIRTHPR